MAYTHRAMSRHLSSRKPARAIVRLTEEPERLALIEDDDQVRRSMTLLLRGRGYAVDVYEGAIELLSLRRRPRVACLLIDFKMAHMNGIELLNRLRAKGDMTPALMITGFFSPTLRKRALAAGFEDVMEKPATADRLSARIAVILGHP